MTGVAARRGGDARLPGAILAVTSAGLAVWLLLLARGSSFWSDDWAFILLRQGHDPDVFLRAFNGHFAAVPVAIYKLLLQVSGLSHHWPYRAAVLGLHIAGVALAWIYLRRRIGAWSALAPALVLLVFGPATELLVYPVNVGFQLAVVCGIGALLLLDGEPRRRPAVGACVLLTVAIASSSVAIAFLIVAACTVLAPATRRSHWWVVGVPAVVYVLWTAGYGADELHWSNAKIAWQYSVEGLARTAGALVGLGPDWGRPLTLGAAALVLWTVARAPRPPVRVIGLALGLVVFWALTAMARAQLGVPGSERFLYPSAVLLVLLLGETLAGSVVPRRLAPVLVAVVVAIVVANGAQLHDQTLAIRDMGAAVSGGVAAVSLEPAATPDAFHPPIQVYGGTAGQLRNAVRLYGSPYPAPTQIEQASWQARRAADDTLRAASTPLLRAAAAPSAALGACPAGGPGQLDMDLPAAGLVVRPGTAPVEVRTRRFASDFGAADATVPAGTARRLAGLPATGSPAWHVRLSSAARFSACSPTR